MERSFKLIPASRSGDALRTGTARTLEKLPGEGEPNHKTKTVLDRHLSPEYSRSHKPR
jgi:hypothetical protein